MGWELLVWRKLEYRWLFFVCFYVAFYIDLNRYRTENHIVEITQWLHATLMERYQ